MYFKLKNQACEKSHICMEFYFYYWELKAAKMSGNKVQIEYILEFLVAQRMMQH